ncbi:MAG: hypothetical protein H7Y01_15780, partial [Ferruginibacter sp.]|nr:hypothetical protein [Chitinophagaceae bacterium]
PFISFDKTSFYFTSDRFNIKRQYDEPLTLPRFLSILDQPMNGKSNIYKLDARTVIGLVY